MTKKFQIISWSRCRWTKHKHYNPSIERLKKIHLLNLRHVNNSVSSTSIYFAHANSYRENTTKCMYKFVGVPQNCSTVVLWNFKV